MSDPIQQQPEASAVAAIVEKYFKPEVLDLEGPDGSKSPVLVLPSGLKAIDVKTFLDPWRTAPVRRQGTAKLADLDSFIAHAKRFKDAESALFAQPNGAGGGPPRLTAVLDYHAAGAIAQGGQRFGTHRGEYTFPISNEWMAWTTAHGQTMNQVQFAEFVENRITDIADPAAAGELAKSLAAAAELKFATPARLLTLSRGLTVRQGVRVKNVSNLSTGEVQMNFESENADETGAPLALPNGFLIAIPVFKSGAVYSIPVRLRYRVGGGSVTWFYELYKHDLAFDNAFEEACERAKTETELPLFVGAPEP